MIENHNRIMEYANEIGNLLQQQFPARPHDNDPPGDPLSRYIPGEHVPEIADEVTLVVANIIQAWLDAGSERDVTMEELGPEIEKHLKGWSTAAE